MATQRIKLKKAIGPHKADKTINATGEELRDLKLEPGKDYDPLGTYPYPVKSDLASTGGDEKPDPKTQTPTPNPQRNP